MLNSEEIKPVAVTIIKLRLSEAISNSSQSVEKSVKKKFLKFHINFVKGVMEVICVRGVRYYSLHGVHSVE